MFETSDIKSFYKNGISKGIKFIGGIRDKGYGQLLAFEDPDGHWLEIFQNNQ